MATQRKAGPRSGKAVRGAKTVPPRIHRHTLIEMNRSVFTARRDAAHARAVAILRREIPGSANKERRTALYTACVALLSVLHAVMT